MSFAPGHFSVADSSVEERSAFITRTYAHLLGAVLAFCALETVFFVTPVAELIVNLILGNGRMGMLVVLGAFMAVSWIADRWAHSDASPAMQYAGLGLYVVAEALIFVPLLAFAQIVAVESGAGSMSLIAEAGVSTAVMFGAMTAIVFITRKDFSFMRGVLMILGVGATGLVFASIIFGFTLGLAFSWAMVALACGYILYQTSALLHTYRPGQHVAAALALFSSVALLFWYILRILIASRRD